MPSILPPIGRLSVKPMDARDHEASRTLCPDEVSTEGSPATTSVAPAPSHELSTIGVSQDTGRKPTERDRLEQSPPVSGEDAKERLPEFSGFQVLRLLGKGAFASVYLAREIDLDRMVALKVSTIEGSEARTMASLEHAHIVQVFSETLDRQSGVRLLCMQYVPGTTLEQVVHHPTLIGRPITSGRQLLDTIDQLSKLPDTFDPSALRDREMLTKSDGIEATCWLGERLAEALAHAHARGVLHRDIKPANILMNQYGRPFLADFNLSFDARDVERGEADFFGGTLGYMSPEHIDAFNPDDETPHSAVNERSDIYSLGMVLFQLITGERPFGSPRATDSGLGTLREMSTRRRMEVPKASHLRPDLPRPIDRVLRCCLDPEPCCRFSTSAELAVSLASCREAQALHRRLPATNKVVRSATAHPTIWLIALLFVPHVLGSIVNITYNSVEIVSDLSAAQKLAFGKLLLIYNLAVYPACLVAFVGLIRPVLRAWREFQKGDPITNEQVTRARLLSLSWPRRAIVLSIIGWLPGSILFPLGIHLLAAPLPRVVYEHFLISFWTSGLIAMTYSYFGVQFMVLRVFYPNLWADTNGLSRQARVELQGREQSIHLFQFLIGLIPLVAAMLLVGLGPEATRSLPFRLLASSLILVGMAGFGLAILVAGRLIDSIHVLTGDSESRPPEVEVH
jgi:eukaryotic-like serine/threonine-protein kinase